MFRDCPYHPDVISIDRTGRYNGVSAHVREDSRERLRICNGGSCVAAGVQTLCSCIGESGRGSLSPPQSIFPRRVCMGQRASKWDTSGTRLTQTRLPATRQTRPRLSTVVLDFTFHSPWPCLLYNASSLFPFLCIHIGFLLSNGFSRREFGSPASYPSTPSNSASGTVSKRRRRPDGLNWLSRRQFPGREGSELIISPKVHRVTSTYPSLIGRTSPHIFREEIQEGRLLTLE